MNVPKGLAVAMTQTLFGLQLLTYHAMLPQTPSTMVQMVTWGDCGATGGFRCLDLGQLLWPSSGGRRQRLGRWRRWAFFLLCLRACRCVWWHVKSVLAAAGWVAPVGVGRRAWLLLVGS